MPPHLADHLGLAWPRCGFPGRVIADEVPAPSILAEALHDQALVGIEHEDAPVAPPRPGAVDQDRYAFPGFAPEEVMTYFCGRAKRPPASS